MCDLSKSSVCFLKMLRCLASAEFQERLDSAVLKSKDEFSFDGHQGWRLRLDEECNRVIRDDFLYEQVSNKRFFVIFYWGLSKC